MLLDVLSLALLALLAVVGAVRGALASGLSLVSLLASYAAGALAGAHLGPEVGLLLELPPLVGAVLAASGTFLAALVLFAAVAALVRHWDRERRQGRSRPTWDRLGGACFGATRAALVVLLIGWLAHWLDAAATVGGIERPTLTRDSTVGRVSQSLVEAGAETALGSADSGPRMASRLLARPAETLSDLQSVMEHPGIQRLAADQTFWEMVQFGAVDRALQRLSFVAIAHDPQLRTQLASIGLIEETASADPVAFRHAAREVLEHVGPRIRSLREDAELQRLARDPEVVGLLEQREVVALLRHPGFQHLVSRVLSEGAEL